MYLKKKIIINIFLLLKIKVLKLFEIQYHLKYLFQNHIWIEREKLFDNVLLCIKKKKKMRKQKIKVEFKVLSLFAYVKNYIFK